MIKVIGKRLLIPPSDRYIALEGDNLSKKVYFCFDEKTLSAAFGDYVNDTSEVGVSLKIMKPGSDSTITAVLTRVPECDVLCGKVWAWTVKRTVTDISGEMQIQLYICYTDDENGTNVIWNSDIGSVFIGDSLDFNEKYDDKEAQIGEFESIVEEASQLITKKVKEELIKTGADIDEFNSHLKNVSNPHGVTAKQIGLGNVDNTSDKDKPISDAAKAALDKKANFDDMQTAMKTLGKTISSHIGSNDNPHKVTAQQIGLGKVNNTADKDKPVSDAVKSELDGKANVSHTHALAGITKEDIDLTACTTVDGEHGNYTINPKSLYGGSALFVLDLDSSKTYEFGGVLESPGYIEVNGEKITEFSPYGGYNSLDFNCSGKISSMRIYLSAGDCTFDYFNALVPNDGFMTSSDKAKLDLLPDESGNEFYADDEFAVGEGNKLGTRGFEIISYSGTQGEIGTYMVRGTESDYNALKAVFDTGEELYITILNKENKDSWCKITAVSFVSGNIVITVDNMYTNSESASYDASATYSKTGVETGFPELGWTIQQREAGNADWQEQACFFICGHPELGTFSWFGSQSAFGDGNILQGKTSATIGLNNRIYGKYGFASGKNIKVGYNDHAFGQDIDFSKVKGAFGAGTRLYADRDAHPIMLGRNLRAIKNDKYIPVQLIAGFFNKNKPRNVFEVGAGHSESLRKNAFEVDRDGQVFADEKFLPLQCITQQNTTFSETERAQKITNVSSQVTFRSPSGLGIRDEKTSAAYGPYVYVHAQKAGLTVGKWYVMAVGITNYSDNWKVLVQGYAKVDGEVEKGYRFTSDEISVSKGERYILCPIYVERLDSSYGFWCEPNIRDITVNSVELYEAKDIGISYKLTDHFPNSVISNESHVEMMNSAIGSNVIIRQSIVSELPKCYTVCDANIKSVFTAPLSGNTTSAAYGLYTGNGYLDGLKAEITEKTSAIEFAAHTASKNNPHGVTKAQIGLSNVNNTSDLNKPVSNAVKAELAKKADVTHTHTEAQDTGVVVDLTAYGAVLQTSGSAKDYYRFEPTASFGDEATPTPEYNYTVFTESDLPLSAKIELIGSDYDGKDCIVVNGAEYKYDPVTQTEPFVLYETITEPIKIKVSGMYVSLKITKYTGQSGFISAMEKAEIAETAAKAEALEKSKANICNNFGGFYAGQDALSLAGVAIGQNAATKNGIAIGKDANSEHCRDAVQIGAGENKENGTVKFYDHKLMNADGSIPAERYAHEHALAGLVETDVDLTTCTVTDGNGSVTSKQLSGSADTFTITLEKGTEYKFKGKLECAGLSITVNGEILATTGDDVSSTSTFEYSGTVDSMTVYIPGGYCTFDNFIAVKRVNGFMTSADKVKLDGLPDDAYSKSENDAKIDLLSLKAEKSGETIRISDACELEQTADVSIASKNLIPYPYAETTKTENGITFTDNGDGSITVNGTATADTGFSCSSFSDISLPKGTYTTSGTPAPSDGGTAAYFTNFAFKHNGMTIQDSFDRGNGLQISLPDGAEKVFVFIRIRSGVTLNNAVFKPQLELGTSATAYTPHVSDISSASVKKYGKNLINYPYVNSTKTTVGITFTDNGDGSVTANGTATNKAYFSVLDAAHAILLQPGTYFLSGNINGVKNAELYVTYRDENSNTKYAVDRGSGIAFTVKKQTSASIGIVINTGVTVNGTVFKPQLELGNAATDYEPYKTPVTYTPDSDGKVSGVTLDSDTATLTTGTDGVIINAKYKKDITKAFEELETKLTNAILSNGGNV